MATCKSCEKKVGFWNICDGNVCPDCFAAKATKEQNKHTIQVRALVKKFTDLNNPELFGIGYWGAVNRQTAGKDMAQAALSGALGMAAPFLVKNSDFAGHISLIALDGDELVIADTELTPLYGIDINTLYIEEEHIQELLKNDPSSYTIKKAPLSAIEAHYKGNTLTLTGNIDISLTLPTTDVLKDTANAQTIAYKINGMSDLTTPTDLIEQIQTNQELPATADLQTMAENSSYMSEFFTQFKTTDKKKQESLLSGITAFPKRFVSEISNCLQRESEGADKRPIISLISLSFGAICGLYGAYGLYWLFQHDDELQQGSFEASGLLEIGIIILAILFVGGGSVGLYEHKVKQWYKNLLDEFLADH